MKNKIASTRSTVATATPTSSTAAAAPRNPTHDQIAERARQLWERKGRPEGRDEEIWYEAERELRNVRSVDDRRFANPDALLDPDGDPNDTVDQRLDELARPPGGRSATSL